jgi:hypothetical protein
VWLLSGLQGVGMGISLPTFLIMVQSSVPRQYLGAATSNVQFSRNIGGTIGVSVMGVLLALRLSSGLAANGLSPGALSLGQLMDPETATQLASIVALVRGALTAGVNDIFLAAGLAATAAWALSVLAPRGRLGDQPEPAARPEPRPAGGSAAAGK